MLILITGASESGKTTLAKAIKNMNIAEVFYFDDIGVPTLDNMVAKYGSPEKWQEWATHEWIHRLSLQKGSVIATGCRFIMNGATHAMDGVSTYPFKIFGKTWKDKPINFEYKGDTVIGNDVWIGSSVTFMPGVKVGDGVIIGSNSVVTKDVAPYTIVAGNPAREIRKRFDDETTDFLVNLRWWDLGIEKITENLHLITSQNIDKLKKL